MCGMAEAEYREGCSSSPIRLLSTDSDAVSATPVLARNGISDPRGRPQFRRAANMQVPGAPGEEAEIRLGAQRRYMPDRGMGTKMNSISLVTSEKQVDTGLPEDDDKPLKDNSDQLGGLTEAADLMMLSIGPGRNTASDKSSWGDAARPSRCLADRPSLTAPLSDSARATAFARRSTSSSRGSPRRPATSRPAALSHWRPRLCRSLAAFSHATGWSSRFCLGLAAARASPKVQFGSTLVNDLNTLPVIRMRTAQAPGRAAPYTSQRNRSAEKIGVEARRRIPRRVGRQARALPTSRQSPGTISAARASFSASPTR